MLAVVKSVLNDSSRWQREWERQETEFRQSITEWVSVHASLSEAEDLSVLLVQISVLIREKGLSREQVRELLEERYGVRSQQMLKTGQLSDWLGFLRTTSA